MDTYGSLKKLALKVETNAIAEYIIIASVIGLLVTSYSIYEAGESLDKLEDASENFQEFESDLNSTEFKNSLEAMKSVEGSDLGDDFSATVSSFEDAKSSVENIDQVRSDISSRLRILRWFNLFTFIGVLVGISLLISKKSDDEE